MKNAKKLLALLLSVLMVMSLGMTVFAEDTNPGSITINDSVSGKSYDLYRIFDLSGSTPGADGKYGSVVYTIASKWAGFFAEGAPGADDYLTDTNTGGTLNVIQTTGGSKFINITDTNVAAFAEAALDYAAKNNIAPDKSETATGSTLGVTDLELGYYMVYPRGAGDIKDTYASICSLTSTVPMAAITIKAVYPTIDKNITETGKDPTKINEAGIGDTVPFTLTTKIPDMTGYQKYFFVAHDTLSAGLTLINPIVSEKNTGFTVKIDGTEITEGTDYDVDIDDDGQSFRIIFKNMVSRTAYSGKDVTIEYSATLNTNALINDANANTATIEYSNDPYVVPTYTPGNEPDNPDDPDDPKYTFKKGEVTVDPTGVSEESKTDTYTTSLTILKVDENKNILSGAKFKLTGDTNKVNVTTSVSFVEDTTDEAVYYKLKGGKYTKDAPVDEGVEVAADGNYVVMETNYELAEGQETFTINEITYRAIKYVGEPSTPDIADDTTRYKHIISNKDKYDQDVLTKKFKKTTTTTTMTDGESTHIEAFVDTTTGLLTFEGLGAGTYTLTESVTPTGYNPIAPITFTVTFNTSSKTFSGSDPIVLELTEIQNKGGSKLPETGGMGTVLFVTVGVVLFMATGIVLTAKKRLYNEG